MNPRQTNERFRSMLDEARQRSGIQFFSGEVSALCENSNCAMRELEMRVQEAIEDRMPPILNCPSCGQRLTVSAVRTTGELNEKF